MSLTHATGPLGTSAHNSVNYAIEGPAHRLLLEPFPRRVRALVGKQVLLDTRRGNLLYESNLPPRFYAPVEALDHDLLEATEHSTHCPFKGDAAYWSIRAGGELRENQIWHYPTPVGPAPWLDGLASFYWEAADRWLDEDEEMIGHLRDPYHRVDLTPASTPISVSLDGTEVVAGAPSLLLSETGLPVRHVVDRTAIDATLEPSETTTKDPYKGHGAHFHVNGVEDAAATYSLLGDGLAFDPAKVELTLDL